MSQTSNSTKSRTVLSIGTVIFYKGFEGVKETKDRWFVVVGANEMCFLTFTTTTNPTLQIRFPTEVTPIIPARSTCLPKDCVVDCRTVYQMDDILMTNYLNSKRVEVKGVLPDDVLEAIYQTTQTSVILEARHQKRIGNQLRMYLDKK